MLLIFNEKSKKIYRDNEFIMEKLVIDSAGGRYGSEIRKIFEELAKTREIKKMTDAERLNFQENLKKLIDCENPKLNRRMEILARVAYFPKEVKVLRNGQDIDSNIADKYGVAFRKIFDELAKTKDIKKMTDSERLNFQKNLKKLIDCENIKLSRKMGILSRVAFFQEK
jgi:hypothetical protein